MKSIQKLFQRHPVAVYFVLAYLIAWAGGFAAVGPRFMRGEAFQFADHLLIFLPMLVGPSLAGIACTAIVDGKKGLRELFSRMFRWRVGLNWVAAALLMFPALIFGVLAALSNLLSPDFTPGFAPVGILVGLFAGFFEEIGWTGYAFPKMQSKHSVLATSIFLGILHVTWHIVPDYLGASVVRGAYWLPHFLAMMLLAMTAMRVLIVWVYTNTKSLLLAQLMHASSTGFLFILGPALISPANDTLWYAVYGVVLWGIVAVVALAYGKQLARQPIVQAQLS